MVVFEELKWTWTAGSSGGFSAGQIRDYYGVTLLSSNRTYTVTVQEDPVHPIAIT